MTTSTQHRFVVWKQPFALTDAEQTFLMPEGATILSAQWTGDQAAMWFLCDPARMTTARTFFVVATGDRFDWDPGWGFIATIQTGNHSGSHYEAPSRVYHLWELPS